MSSRRRSKGGGERKTEEGGGEEKEEKKEERNIYIIRALRWGFSSLVLQRPAMFLFITGFLMNIMLNVGGEGEGGPFYLTVIRHD